MGWSVLNTQCTTISLIMQLKKSEKNQKSKAVFNNFTILLISDFIKCFLAINFIFVLTTTNDTVNTYHFLFSRVQEYKSSDSVYLHWTLFVYWIITEKPSKVHSRPAHALIILVLHLTPCRYRNTMPTFNHKGTTMT